VALCPCHHRLHHRGPLGLTGSADGPDGLTFTDDRGRPIDSAAHPTLPTGPPPDPVIPYEHPIGGPLDRWPVILPTHHSGQLRRLGRSDRLTHRWFHTAPHPTQDGSVTDRKPSMVVELDVSDVGRSVDFYVAALGFRVAVDRPERRFAYLTLGGESDLMLQSADGPGDRLRTAALERPFGRGVSVVIPCRDVDALFSWFVAAGGQPITPIEERTYDIDVVHPTSRWPDMGPRRVTNRQFVVADPDGYVLRFYSERAS
jgi:catechol 2,3-dioxygenase-like lactoylglutathione lyase family enzyme